MTTAVDISDCSRMRGLRRNTEIFSLPSVKQVGQQLYVLVFFYFCLFFFDLRSKNRQRSVLTPNLKSVFLRWNTSELLIIEMISIVHRALFLARSLQNAGLKEAKQNIAKQ